MFNVAAHFARTSANPLNKTKASSVQKLTLERSELFCQDLEDTTYTDRKRVYDYLEKRLIVARQLRITCKGNTLHSYCLALDKHHAEHEYPLEKLLYKLQQFGSYDTKPHEMWKSPWRDE